MKFFIGPCVLESESLVLEVATFLKEKVVGEGIEIVFKGSFDKANRTAIDSYRGPGIEKGLLMLERVKKDYGFQTVTDFHLPDQADEVASVVDFLQVPAFLCRQTDLVLAGAKACEKYGKNLKIKKAQFLGPWDMKNVVTKAATVLPLEKILLTERGTCFGYNNLVVDMASFQIMKAMGVQTVHDATHCVQKPGGLGNITGGKREQVIGLARAAVAAGADHVFMECHPRPDEALSDKTTSLALEQIPYFVEQLNQLQLTIRGLDARK